MSVFNINNQENRPPQTTNSNVADSSFNSNIVSNAQNNKSDSPIARRIALRNGLTHHENNNNDDVNIFKGDHPSAPINSLISRLKPAKNGNDTEYISPSLQRSESRLNVSQGHPSESNKQQLNVSNNGNNSSNTNNNFNSQAQKSHTTLHSSVASRMGGKVMKDPTLNYSPHVPERTNVFNKMDVSPFHEKNELYRERRETELKAKTQTNSNSTNGSKSLISSVSKNTEYRNMNASDDNPYSDGNVSFIEDLRSGTAAMSNARGLVEKSNKIKTILMNRKYWIPQEVQIYRNRYYKSHPREAMIEAAIEQAAITAVQKEGESLEDCIQRALGTIVHIRRQYAKNSKRKRVKRTASNVRKIRVRKQKKTIKVVKASKINNYPTIKIPHKMGVDFFGVDFTPSQKAAFCKAYRKAYTSGHLKPDEKALFTNHDMEALDFLIKYRFASDADVKRVLGSNSFYEFKNKVKFLQGMHFISRNFIPLDNYFYVKPLSNATKISYYGFLGTDNVVKVLKSYKGHALGLSSLASHLMNHYTSCDRAEHDILGVGEDEYYKIRHEIKDNVSHIVAEREYRSAWTYMKNEASISNSPSAITPAKYRHRMEEYYHKARPSLNIPLKNQTQEFYCTDPKLRINQITGNRVCPEAWLWVVFGNDIIQKGLKPNTIRRLPVEKAAMDGKGRPIIVKERGDITSTRDHCPDMVIARPRDLVTGRPNSLAIELELTPKTKVDYMRTMAGYTSVNGRILYKQVIWLVTNASVASLIREGAEMAGCTEGKEFIITPVASKDVMNVFSYSSGILPGTWRNPDKPLGYAIPKIFAKNSISPFSENMRSRKAEEEEVKNNNINRITVNPNNENNKISLTRSLS